MREIKAMMQVPGTAQARLAVQDGRVAQIKAAAMPPPAMAAAPAAPARGVMLMVPDYAITRGGMRQRVGAHWQACDGLMKLVGLAARRHEKSGSTEAFVPPFSAAQMGVAAEYRSLSEWRDGSPIRSANLEAGRAGGGGGSRGFIDVYIERCARLKDLASVIGHAAVLQAQRGPDGSRRTISARRLVDLVVLEDLGLTDVLRRHGWDKAAANRACLIQALSAALDRMADVSPRKKIIDA
jgi:hypothetical protein